MPTYVVSPESGGGLKLLSSPGKACVGIVKLALNRVRGSIREPDAFRPAG